MDKDLIKYIIWILGFLLFLAIFSKVKQNNIISNETNK